MDSVLKKGLFLVTISSLVMGISPEVQAADTDSVLPGAGIEEVLNDYDASDHKVQVKEYLVPTEKGEYSDMAFANVHSFLYIRSEPTKQSKWVGKLYPDYAAKIKGPVGEWTKIKSGDVTGYVYSQYITIGKKPKKAKEMKNFIMRDPEKRKKQSLQNSGKQVQPKRTMRTVADQAVVRRLWSMPAVLSEILMYGVVQALHMVLTVRGLYSRYISISVYSFQEHRLRCAVREEPLATAMQDLEMLSAIMDM